MNHRHRGSHVIACDMLLAYYCIKSGPKIDPLGKLHDTDAGSNILFPKLTKNDLLDK